MNKLMIDARDKSAIDLARKVLDRHNHPHIHLSKAETEALADTVIKFTNGVPELTMENMRPPLGKEPRCKCGHLVSQHFQHDPGLCNECSECKGFERETPVGNDDPHDQGSGANARQVGGEHYGLSNFQHWDLVALFDLDYFQGQITKYVMRWSKKNGVVDLEKAQHFLEKYIELIKNKKIKANA